jgi:hypothetical protein
MASDTLASHDDVVAAYKISWAASSFEYKEPKINTPATDFEVFLMAERLVTLRAMDEDRFKQLCELKGVRFNMEEIKNLACHLRTKFIE